MPRINRAIELLEQGQPIFYGGGYGLTYDDGIKAVGTHLDYILFDFEHTPFDVAGLRAFMKGLADGGPTKSGHRTPAVVVTLPLDGISEESIRVNAWQIKQTLAAGVHGLLLVNAETPEAVRAFVSACRYAFQKIGLNALPDGRRSNGGQGYAAQIWGLSADEYLQRADPWPLNPNGELMLGLKIENKRALANAETTLAVPGIAFTEWGPGDMGFSLRPSFEAEGYDHDPPYGPEMERAMQRVRDACKANGIAFLSSMHEDDWRELYEMGVRVSGARGPELADTIRRHAGRTMPW
jgi:4-hydroxy-2-oxoheptanedioate aldolase